MTRHNKHMKPSRPISELSRVVPLRHFSGNGWAVNFADPSEAMIVVSNRRTWLNVIIWTANIGVLQAISEKLMELAWFESSRIDCELCHDGFLINKCKPADVAAIAETVCRVEGKRLAEIDSPKPAPVAPMVVICHVGEQSPAC